MKCMLLLFPVLFASALGAQSPAAPFRVGTWNLEFLGGPPNLRGDTPPRDEGDYAAIGKKIVELGVAVLAVQEINDEGSLKKVAAGAGPSWDVVLGTSGGWNDGKTAQHIGFVFDRAAVDLLYAEELLQLPREFEGQPIFHRVPVTACFKHKASGCDFRLVTVHFKAGKNATDGQKRRGESQALAKWLDHVRSGANEDADVVLLGDFNSTYGTEPEVELERSERMLYLEHATATPTIMHFPEPIDQIAGSTGFAELRIDSLAVDNDCDGLPREQWRKVYSDHFPVTAAIVASSDDDPAASFSRGAPEHALPAGKRAQPAAATMSHTAPAWPPAVGTPVRVVTTTNATFEGRLLRPIPDGPGGWVAIEDDGAVFAVPMQQVASVSVRPQKQ